MSTNRSVILLLLLGGVAIATNPDERSFQKYVETDLKEQGATWIEQQVVSRASSLIYRRKDFKFFSLVKVDADEIYYVGCFSHWFAIPSWALIKRIMDAQR
ncbi:hypothetical protein MIR68_000776 [Amoeboaphelidium protococcarum]|nr:hypothetical protein MIR68_000776 [Amoeboaphelidium protococcarum]KAI3645978.1 hypothetical protein MP228_008906 [Amoeboaphelidium protococcarum]KAI3649946.1 hypothetical protein MP228_005578 [Amoeboaphelidium protococcarum]